MIQGTRIEGAITKGVADRKQVYFTDKSLVIIELPRFTPTRLKLMDAIFYPGDWSPEESIALFEHLEKRKKQEIPLELINFVEVKKPKRGLILKGKPGFLRFWLANGQSIELKLGIDECDDKTYEKIVGLLNILFPGKIRVHPIQ